MKPLTAASAPAIARVLVGCAGANPQRNQALPAVEDLSMRDPLSYVRNSSPGVRWIASTNARKLQFVTVIAYGNSAEERVQKAKDHN